MIIIIICPEKKIDMVAVYGKALFVYHIAESFEKSGFIHMSELIQLYVLIYLHYNVEMTIEYSSI